jgi:hypothetical protein
LTLLLLNNNFLVRLWYKNLFFLFFLVSNLRKKKKRWLDFCCKRRKSWLISIMTIENIDFGVSEFHLMRRNRSRCSFSYSLLEMEDLSLKSFLFHIEFGFLRSFGLFETTDVFLKVFRMFFYVFWVKNLSLNHI